MTTYDRRWNGWGKTDSEFVSSLSDGAREALTLLVGEGKPSSDVSKEDALALVPASRIAEHALISVDAEDRLMHACGQSLPDLMALRSGEINVFPDGVAFPETTQQVRELLDFASSANIDVIPYGGGTSVVGHINPLSSDKPVLTIDMGRMNKLMDFDPESQIATFGAGTPGPELEEQLKEKGYTLGHFPQSWELSTVGGWVASRSSGQQSLRYGRIEQMFAGGRIETPAGALDIPTIPASSAGPDIREMILGSEGRMGVLTEVKVRATPLAQQETFHVAFLPNWEAGVATVREMAQQKLQLSMLRLSNLMETITMMASGGDPDANAELEASMTAAGLDINKVMITFGVTGSNEQHQSALNLARACLAKHGGVEADSSFGDRWAHGRFSAPYWREALWESGYCVDTMETAVNWDNVIESVANIEASISQKAEALGRKVHVYTHLSHMYGQGCSIYSTYIFACDDSVSETRDLWLTLKTAGAQATVAQGGTISHQHGVGYDHKNYLPAEKGELGIRAIRQLCEMFDPEQRMNPGKLLPDS